MKDFEAFLFAAIFVVGACVVWYTIGKQSVAEQCEDFGMFKSRNTIYTCEVKE